MRSFRLFRPLMGLKMFPALKNILLSIGKAIGAMKEISTIIIYVFIIYAVMGLQVIYLKQLILIYLYRCGKVFF